MTSAGFPFWKFVGIVLFFAVAWQYSGELLFFSKLLIILEYGRTLLTFLSKV